MMINGHLFFGLFFEDFFIYRKVFSVLFAFGRSRVWLVGWLVGWSYMIIAELAELAIFLTPRSAKVAGVWG